jgi:hypothetical protein
VSLGMLMTGIVEYVGDVIVNDCGRPVPDRMLRYHGTIPSDCCPANGLLAVNWGDGRASESFGSSSGTQQNDPCAARPVYQIQLRYKTCWPVPDADQSGVVLIDPEWDETAAMLADVADCVTRALIALTCGAVSDAFTRAVRDQTAGRWLRYAATTPILPLGGCAGVLWTLTAAPLPGPVS